MEKCQDYALVIRYLKLVHFKVGFKIKFDTKSTSWNLVFIKIIQCRTSMQLNFRSVLLQTMIVMLVALKFIREQKKTENYQISSEQDFVSKSNSVL